jgi:hypothetical protein
VKDTKSYYVLMKPMAHGPTDLQIFTESSFLPKFLFFVIHLLPCGTEGTECNREQ